MGTSSIAYLDEGLLSIAAGDALGVTSEFVPLHRIPTLYHQFRSSGWPFAHVGGGWLDLPAGGHSDDTEMSLCIYQSIKGIGRFDPEDIAARFVTWMRSGPRDIGSTVLRSLTAISIGRRWAEAGKPGFFNSRAYAPNGSLMRNGLIGYLPVDLHMSFLLSFKQCIITHYAPIAVLCCCAQTYIIRLMLEGKELASTWPTDLHREWTTWIATERDPVLVDWLGTVGESLEFAWSRFMRTNFDPESFDPFSIDYSGRSSCCLLTLQISVWVLHWSVSSGSVDIPDSFPREVFSRKGPWALGWVAMLGNDSDTYCATAGPMLSAMYGGLPEDLLKRLMVRDWM